ncbi:hypothetical protein J6590_082170 [Homalodisca vitripennis]|nr:hypothetical protein J6590_082170 [Homalodisca vitripennis]
MEREFADILKQIGCTDGLAVPVANEENRLLQKEVENKLKLKADLMMKLEIQEENRSEGFKNRFKMSSFKRNKISN